MDENLALACPSCNQHKGSNLSGIDPVTDAIVPLFNPRKDDWDEHFGWFGAIIVAKTAVGRASVDVLALNESYQVKIRAALSREDHMS